MAGAQKGLLNSSDQVPTELDYFLTFMGLGLAANVNPGIVNVPGRDPEAQAVAESLLERDRENHHCFFNPQGFHNHLSHQ